MPMRRHVIIIALVVPAICFLAFPAAAGGVFGRVTCDQNPHPGCDLLAGGDGPSTPAPSSERPSTAAPRSGGAGGQAHAASPADRAIGAPSVAKADCSYVRSDYQSATDSAQPVSYQRRGSGALVVRPAVLRSSGLSVRPVATQAGQGPGAWYVYQCTTDGQRDALYRPPVWIADAAPGAAAAPDPAALAEQARSQLRLAGPRIDMNPTSDQLVGLPTWLWLDPAGWNQVAATAAAGGVSVTALARPVQVVWSAGDGGTVTCNGPGTPFPAGGNPTSASPDCGYTYRHRSLDEAGGTFAVTATVRWDVTWSGVGQAGAFAGLTTVSTAVSRVIDVPALTTGGG
ncbi:ATP/GTP-binding protein [Frankia sp. AiPs1]